MSVTNISLSDILVGLLLLFSIYVLITKNGWKKGSIYLVGLLVIGSFLAIASIYFSSSIKYIIAISIVLIGIYLNKKRTKKKH